MSIQKFVDTIVAPQLIAGNVERLDAYSGSCPSRHDPLFFFVYRGGGFTVSKRSGRSPLRAFNVRQLDRADARGPLPISAPRPYVELYIRPSPRRKRNNVKLPVANHNVFHYVLEGGRCYCELKESIESPADDDFTCIARRAMDNHWELC